MQQRDHKPRRAGVGAVMEAFEGRRLLSSTISGVVFDDANANGLRDAAESVLRKQTIFIDSNFNGRFDAGERATLSNSKGQYSFTGLTPGIYRVSIVLPPKNWRQTSPARNFYDIPATGFDIHAANDFGLTMTAIVRGTVFNDTNHNGVKDITERGVSGVTVFIDKNNNGKLDRNEKSRVSDGSGNYRFRGLARGTYVIRISPPPGLSVTAPLAGFYRVRLNHGQSLSNRNFGLA